MKITLALVLFILLFHYGYCHAQGKSDGLLATPYPGCIVETNPGITDPAWRKIVDARSQTHYTKDPMEKVKAHYTKLLGSFEEYEKDYIYNKGVVSFKDVYDIVMKRGGEIGEGGNSFYGGTFAGVTLYGKVTNNSYHYSVLQVFDALTKAYLGRVQDPDNFDPAAMAKHLEDPELKKVGTQYEHLKWAYFMETKEKRKDNLSGTLSMDEVIYDKYFTAPAEARKKELEDVQKKYNDAMAKMQYDAATKLGDKMMKLSGVQPDYKEQWDTAIKCFEEMEKHAYATKIVIDTHPSGWDLTPPKN